MKPFAHVRQVTGLPYQYHSYVRDRETGKVIAACGHRHTRRGNHSGYYFALNCAERMLRKVIR